ncbi:MAG: hypothetical protein DCF31_00980 [Alphaproteobacteria bacterium]|nr:MAG: hypothetical protein DCF31_00980 [Alphaproteobacteria bacterium]
MLKFMTAIGVALAAAPAAAANPTEFLKLCEATMPVASCGCVANELLQSRDGQVSLDAYAAVKRPPAEQRAAALAVANKYGMKISEVVAAAERSKPLFSAAVERCK